MLDNHESCIDDRVSHFDAFFDVSVELKISDESLGHIICNLSNISHDWYLWVPNV